MTFILLTNDDGIDAPALPVFARELQRLGDVEVVVPHTERSWVGKAITRFEDVAVETVEVDGIPMHTTTGYPADCVQLGIHLLFGRRPDVVVSGINLGYNHGSAYMQSSGTVGAVLEASVAEVSGIAFSTGVTNQDWSEWRRWAESEESADMWARLSQVAAGITREMLGSGFSGTVSVGLPGTATNSTERRLTRVAQVGYDMLFAEAEPGVYRHAFGGIGWSEEDLGGTDIQAAMEGVIAITPVEGAGFSEKSRALADRLTTGS